MMTKFKQTSDEKMSDLKRCMEAKRGGFSKRGSNQAK
jgi:S1 RNA binding domain protein